MSVPTIRLNRRPYAGAARAGEENRSREASAPAPRSGALTPFLTPIAHHENFLILDPGQYTFGDFFRIGVPLTICISLVSAWLAQYIWLGGPLLPAWAGG